MAFDWKGAGQGSGLGGSIGGGLGSLFGDMAGSGDRDTIKRILEQLQAEAGPSAYAGITEDPALRTDQLSSVAALRDIANSGGMRTQDKVGLQEAADVSNRNEQMQRGAILQNMGARGMGGSGAELAAQLSSQQGGAQRVAQAGAQAASDASKRALQAVSQYGDAAGKIRSQDLTKNTAVAGGEDAMSRFNAGQRVAKADRQAGFYDSEQQRKRNTGAGIGSALGGIAGTLTGGLL